jgi:hypothetical protein
METEREPGTRRDEELSVDKLVDLVRQLQQTIRELQAENARLKEQLKDLDGRHPTQRLDEEYSLESEEKRSRSKRRRQQKSPRRGRRSTEEKLAEADRHETVFPDDVSPDDCTPHYSRVVWRIENGLAD